MYRMIGTHIAAGLAILICSAAVSAQGLGSAMQSQRVEQVATELQKRFESADADHNGQLTKTEAQKMPRVAKNFQQIDSAGLGYVTLDQIKTFVANQLASSHSRQP